MSVFEDELEAIEEHFKDEDNYSKEHTDGARWALDHVKSLLENFIIIDKDGFQRIQLSMQDALVSQIEDKFEKLKDC